MHLYESIERITEWLDSNNVDMNRNSDEAMRIMKIGEEFGEVVQAYIGMTGQNPSKGITHTVYDVANELADVVVTAMCAMQYLINKGVMPNWNVEFILMDKIRTIRERSEI